LTARKKKSYQGSAATKLNAEPVVAVAGKPAGNVPFPIIGIGASAGGLEALELFLSHVPKGCGLTFIVIQHLSPDYTGHLSELLQRVTPMRVQQVNGTMPVQPDHVYVIPPNKTMSIRNRTLHLQPPTEKLGLRLPIDFFMRSLATDCAEMSIGVVLSGMGADGTLGLAAIKEQAGLTLVQEPATAKFDSMPQSVIAAGFADIVAPAAELPGRIIDYLGCVMPRWKAEPSQQDIDQRQYEKIISLIKTRTRHDFSLYKPTSVQRRIERRMAIYKLDSLADYAGFLQQNAQEAELLFKELLIGVTSFFRDAALWEQLKNQSLPQLLAAHPEGGTLRAWSCGCSTGEEAYSLAILFREALEQVKQPGHFSLQIFATDLDAEAIEKARRGSYAATIEAEVSPERLQRFFCKEQNQYRVSQEVREMVIFAQHNIIMDPPFTKLDILLCRNLLIYFSAELQHKLLPLFHYSLNPGGLLFLGNSESIGTGAGLFAATAISSKLFWRNKSMLRNSILTFPIPLSSKSLVVSQQDPIMLKTVDNLQPLADHLILQHFSAPTVLVTAQGDIVYISGSTGKYLEPAAGKANLNFFAMAREGLQYPLGSAFRQALCQHQPVTVRAELEGSENGKKAVDMTLLKIEAPAALQGMVLIAFKDVPLVPKPKRRRAGTPADSKRVEELEQQLLKISEELRVTHEEMQTSHEELKSTNEELQSTNEELQSTNEELTTSKEEMQAMNEELQSVNAEQAIRLDDFKQVSNDMENLLNSTEIVTIFLDNQLQVRRFTTGANNLFKLIPGDVGQPLADIASNLNYPQLYDHVQDVLKKLIAVETQVSTLTGRWFLVRIIPYRTMDKMIDGVVITCNDITAAKQLEDELREEIARLSV
jgi:two-component system CheB/CheR fusion protein